MRESRTKHAPLSEGGNVQPWQIPSTLSSPSMRDKRKAECIPADVVARSSARTWALSQLVLGTRGGLNKIPPRNWHVRPSRKINSHSAILVAIQLRRRATHGVWLASTWDAAAAAVEDFFELLAGAQPITPHRSGWWTCWLATFGKYRDPLCHRPRCSQSCCRGAKRD